MKKLTLNALWDLATDPDVDPKTLVQLYEKSFVKPAYGLASKPWETSDSSVFYRPLGACGAVTGSAHQVYVAPHDKYVLVDCGAYQGEEGWANRTPGWHYYHFEQKVHAIILTHAHLDHVGDLKNWLNDDRHFKIYCTRATAELAAHRLDLELTKPAPEGTKDWERGRYLAGRLVYVDEEPAFRWGKYLPMEGLPGVSVAFMRNSHLSGSVSVQIRADIPGYAEAEIQFSGDVSAITDGAQHQGLWAARHVWAHPAPTIVLESTNGDRPDRDPCCVDGKYRLQRLADAVSAANARGPGATLIIPAFVMGRTTDILADLAVVLKTMRAEMCLLPEDGEPTISICSGDAAHFARAVGRSLLQKDAEGVPLWANTEGALHKLIGAEGIAQLFDPDGVPANGIDEFTQVSWAKEPVRTKGLSIIIVGSGATSIGQIVGLIAEHARDPRATLLLTGYCPEGSPGAQLKALAELTDEARVAAAPLTFPEPQRQRDRAFAEIAAAEVKMHVVDMSTHYSGHADAKGLVDYVHRAVELGRDVDVILTHGTESARERLAQRLQQPTADGRRPVRHAYCPSTESPWYDVAHRRWARVDAGELRSSQVIKAVHQDGEVRSVYSVAKAIRTTLTKHFGLNCSEIVTADDENIRSFHATDGERRHQVQVQQAPGERTEIQVTSQIGLCDTRQQFAERLFPWPTVLAHLTSEKVPGVKLVGIAEELTALKARIDDPTRRTPIFVFAPHGRSRDHVRDFAERIVVGAGEVYVVAREVRHMVRQIHLGLIAGTRGEFFPPRRADFREKLCCLQAHDMAPRLVQVLNEEEDALRRERRPGPAA